MKIKSKNDLVIIDNSSNVNSSDSITELKSLKAFSNATICKLTDSDVGLSMGTKTEDSIILKKAEQLSKTGNYRTITIITQDKGKDGDVTFKKAYKNIGIIYHSQNTKVAEMIKENLIVNDLKSISGYLVEVSPKMVKKTKYPKYGKTQQTHIKRIKEKSFSQFTK